MEHRDKNMQDDWIADLTRYFGATSKELTEYGGDLKDVSKIKNKDNNVDDNQDDNKKDKIKKSD